MLLSNTNQQQEEDIMALNKIVIYTGGTTSSISPHFSFCSEAHGSIGRTIYSAFFKDLDFIRKGKQCIDLRETKLAGGQSISSNEDLLSDVKDALADNTVTHIIMAAAVCDFVPVSLAMHDDSDVRTEFGKDTPRLSSASGGVLEFEPAPKIIDIIKEIRPDITLITFKTTSDESFDYLEEKCQSNIARTGADFCFGNDIKNHYNIISVKGSTLYYDTREKCVEMLVSLIQGI